MATVTMCDVKICGDIIKGKAYLTTMADKKYELCKKCYDGLAKFLNENLNDVSQTEPPITKIEQADLQKMLTGMSPNITTWPQGPFYTMPKFQYNDPFGQIKYGSITASTSGTLSAPPIISSAGITITDVKDK